MPNWIRGPPDPPDARRASKQETEAIWVAAEMRAGGAYAHSLVALDELGGEKSMRPRATAGGADSGCRPSSRRGDLQHGSC
jgi:hypothetical protein